ncbi:MAG: FxsA family protein [Solirubrobacteraceae bacterium]
MLVAFVLLICWPVAELLVAIRVAQAIGALDTVALVIFTWPLGIWAMRSQGRAAWQRLSIALAAGRSPGVEIVDGALVLVGGVLLIVPGFITDVLGISLLLPPTRWPLRRLLYRNLASRAVAQTMRFGRHTPGYDVDATATDVASAAIDLDDRRLAP